jgi:hypothetical protein
LGNLRHGLDHVLNSYSIHYTAGWPCACVPSAEFKLRVLPPPPQQGAAAEQRQPLRLALNSVDSVLVSCKEPDSDLVCFVPFNDCGRL